ncbi:TauD/TfdA family dioxygenase [Streptomyces sp. NBC_01433]|uniref:TauD/TfdA family dioxygenase n=1 Tax=Streptomyces sp. NBC_01433 TaxID=2903864 RepID=UPI002254D4CE|nr:TauD/TfdA family dioxygenase [Streptomyces sp. NBC_01433]MCX4680635.1 TauD/TfdA family dioxygenase [Streptomyces sp. NBC_01433]
MTTTTTPRLTADRDREDRPSPDVLHLHELSPGDARTAEALAAALLRRHGTPDSPGLLAEAPVAAARLPDALLRASVRARGDDTKHAFIIRGNRGAESLGPTPRHWDRADTEESRISACLLVLYSALLGDLIGWSSQQDGRLVTDVLPVPGMEKSLVSGCSERELGWHTEDAFSPHRADHVGLMALRNPDSTPTTVSYVDVPRLAPAAARVLAQPRFVIRPDDSHTDPGQGAGPQPVPVLSGHPDSPVLRIDRDFTTALDGDAEAESALALLVEHIDHNLYDIPINPGDVCFLDNRTVVHGRRPFVPRYDGLDRWLKRVNVVTDLRRTRPGRSSAADRIVR